MAPRFAGVDLSKYEIDKSLTEMTPRNKAAVNKAIVATLITLVVIALLCVGPTPSWGIPRPTPS